MGNRFDSAAVKRMRPALIAASVLILLAVLGDRWKPGGTWPESEVGRTDARVADIEWLDDDSMPHLMCMRKIWQYKDHSGKGRSFMTRESWVQKPTINGQQIIESGKYVRTDLLDRDDFWAASPYEVTPQGKLDAERHARTETLKIKYLIDRPEQWRDAAKDDDNGYFNKPAWLSFLVVVVPGCLTLKILLDVFKEAFPGRMQRRRRFQRET